MSLALSTLIYEWRRYLAAIIALAFSGLLVLAQVGMFMGIGKAFTASIDRSRAEVMVLGPKSESLFNGGAGMPRRIMPLIYLNPEVADVKDLMGNGGMWANHPGKGAKQIRDYVQVMGVDTEPGATTLPTDYPESVRVALLEPYAVAVDQSTLKRLGVKLGDEATLNGKTVRVRAILTNYPNVAQAMVSASRQTVQLLGMEVQNNRVGPLMVRLRDPSKAVLVRDQLNHVSNGLFRAWTREELGRANESALLKDQLVGVMLVFSLLLGTGIGIGITWQTLRGAVFANIKEFASLRALGVSMGSLRVIVIELSFWVGIAGLGATAVLVTGVTALAGAGGLPMAYSPVIVAVVAVMLVVIALVSGFLSMGVLKQSQPADLLR